jgi:hypothetical protein
VALFEGIPSYYGICGKLGGVVYQRSKYGFMGRARRYTLSYPSFSKQRLMAAMHALAAMWAYTLTNAQRLSWGVYANQHPIPAPCTGIRFLTPMNWFIKLNMPLYLAGTALLLYAP